jgi:peroxiredoxin
MFVSFKRKIQWLVMCLGLFTAGALYMQSSHDFALSQRAMTEVSEGIEIGDRASEISLKNINGEWVELKDFSNNKVLLIFFTSWCHVCAEQWGQLEAAAGEGLLEGIEIVAVNLTKEEMNKGAIQTYADNLPLENLTILLDEDGFTQNSYRIYGIPTLFLINDSGIIEERLHSLLKVEDMMESSFFRQ